MRLLKCITLILFVISGSCFADVTTIGEGVDTAYTKDCFISSYTNLGYNYGATPTVEIESRTSLGAKYERGLIWFDHTVFTGEASAIAACTLWIKIQSNSVSGSATNTIDFFAISAANYWREGGQNGACPGASVADTGTNWAKRRCYDDGGPCGTCSPGPNVAWEGSGGLGTVTTDYLTTDSVSVNFTGAGTGWKPVDLTDMVTAFVAGDYTNQGILIRNNYAGSTGNEAVFSFTSGESTGNEWYVEITTSSGPPDLRHSSDGPGLRHSQGGNSVRHKQ